MACSTRTARTSVAGSTGHWRSVHEVVGPLAGHDAPLGLYVHGGAAGRAVATSTGIRHRLEIGAGAAASFGSYCNAFPAGLWREHVGTGTVRLVVEVDDVAVLTVRRSDGTGASTVVAERLLDRGARAEVLVALDGTGDGGLLWFDLRAGGAPVGLVAAAWQVASPPRGTGGLVLGMPTVGRVADVAANLARIATASALMDVVERIVVIDHCPVPIRDEEALAGLRPRFGDRLRIVRQRNLGGSGGFSRVMHEASLEPDAGAALLLDDDIVVEPAALLKAWEFARRTRSPQLVGLQMLDTARPGVLDAAAERIEPRSFWWEPADPRLAAADVASAPVSGTPALHRLAAADFAGWWGCLVPLEVVERIGYALPLFLKWDDAEYALRARAAGFGTVSLVGAAVWHESWRTKDDARTWPAYFHARNRLVAALLHGAPGVRSGVLRASLLLELKQLLAHQTFAVERRHEGLAALFDGPEALHDDAGPALARLLALSAAAPDQHRLDPAGLPAAADGRTTLLSPEAPPTGARLGLWAAALLLRHLMLPARCGRAPVTRLAEDRGTWWVLPRYDEVLTPTADRAAYFHVRREPGRFRRTLVTSVRLHVRLWVAWPALRHRYRCGAAALAAPAAWAERFAEPAP